MSGPELRERLRREPIPGELESEERAWEMVRAAYAERAPAPRARRGRLALALAAAGLLVALLLSPAGARVREWIRDAVEPGVERAEPALTSLPAPGRLLVESRQGPWIVQDDGYSRLLGDYEEATWSPSGLFVAVASGRQLNAVVGDPAEPAVGGQAAGTVRWSLSRPAVSEPVWAPTGFRLAYRSAGTLRVVGGDGAGDERLRRTAGPAPPAWQPLSPGERRDLERAAEAGIPGGRGAHELAVARPDGSVELVDTDSGATLWRTAAGPVPDQLQWSGDGGRLAAVAPDGVRTFSGAGRLRFERAPGRGRFAAIAYRPGTHRLAAIRTSSSSAGDVRSVISLIGPGGRYAGERGRPRPALFSVSGRLTELTWSPSGRWLLVAWPQADQWLFIRPRGGDREPRVEAVSNISDQFDPGARRESFPRVSGWVGR